jgi:hypothetical protein
MAYWITSLGLIAFGFLGMFSIGRPFFLVGLAMLVLGPVRRRPMIFWPSLLAVVAYNVGYWAVAPLHCTDERERAMKVALPVGGGYPTCPTPPTSMSTYIPSAL